MWLWPSLNAPYDITSPILKTNEDCRDLFGYFNLILLLYWLSQYPTRHLIKLVQPFRNRLRILEKSYYPTKSNIQLFYTFCGRSGYRTTWMNLVVCKMLPGNFFIPFHLISCIKTQQPKRK